MSEKEIVAFCKSELSLMLGIPESQLRDDMNFEKMRINSMHAMQLLDELEDRLSVSISPLAFWENPTLAEFGRHVAGLAKSSHS